MKIVLCLVSSLNGKIDAGALANSSSWASEEDAALFAQMKSQYRLIVMGRKTYEVNKRAISIQTNTLRIIMTRTPKKYSAQTTPNQLEFTNVSPEMLVGQLEQRGYNEMLLAGGGEINRLFFRKNLVDELHLSVEPTLISRGTNIIAEYASVIPLQLVSVTKLNTRGTLHVVYSVIR